MAQNGTSGILTHAGTILFNMPLGNSGTTLTVASGAPEGSFSASQGSLFLRTDGGAGTTIYVKESGGTSKTGWVGK